MNDRTAQIVAAGFAFLLIVLVGATIFILLSRPAGPTPSPTATAPSLVPSVGPTSTLVTPLPTASGTALSTPTLLPTATPTQTPSLVPTISPTPSPTPSATPTLPPSTSAHREVTIVDFGIDPHIDFTDVPRTIVFGVDGPSMISAQLSGVNSGKVRMCLRREDANAEKQCQQFHSGTLSRAVFDAGHTEWNVSLISAGSTLGQFGTLTLSFNSLAPEIHLNSFRFNGTNDPHNNGFLVLFGDQGTSDGTFTFHAGIDDGHGNNYVWHFDLAVDDVSTLEQDGGPSTSATETTPITGGTGYNLTFEESEAIAGGGAFPVFVDARLTWP